VGQFKLRHPEVYGIDDAGGIMGGRLGKEILYWGFNICEWSTGGGKAWEEGKLGKSSSFCAAAAADSCLT
jgi:hypothetical protein